MVAMETARAELHREQPSASHTANEEEAGTLYALCTLWELVSLTFWASGNAIMHRLFSCELCLRRLHRLMILETAISLATKRLG